MCYRSYFCFYLDILNLTKIVFKDGVSGTIILGERYNKIFTALSLAISYLFFIYQPGFC